MKIQYSKVTDVLQIQLSEKAVSDEQELKPGITFRFAEDGTIAGINIIEASRHVEHPSSIQLYSS